jgi:hypothetical protein
MIGIITAGLAHCRSPLRQRPRPKWSRRCRDHDFYNRYRMAAAAMAQMITPAPAPTMIPVAAGNGLASRFDRPAFSVSYSVTIGACLSGAYARSSMPRRGQPKGKTMNVSNFATHAPQAIESSASPPRATISAKSSPLRRTPRHSHQSSSRTTQRRLLQTCL